MKQNICVVIFLLLSTTCKAQNFPSLYSVRIESFLGYMNVLAYLNKNDFVVGL